MEKILDRFLRYVAVDTQSDPTSETQPSAAKELDLLKILKDDSKVSSQIRYVFVLYSDKVVSAHFSTSFQQWIFCNYSPDDRCLSGTHLAHDIYEISRVYIHVQTVYYSRFAVEDVCSLEGDYWCPAFHVQKISITTQI